MMGELGLNYTCTMARKLIGSLVLICMLTAFVFTATRPEYAKGIITVLIKTTRTRTVGYQVNTPLQRDDDVYTLSVQVGTIVYSGEFIPYDEGSAFPEDLWHEGDVVEVRVGAHDLWMRRPAGRDIRLYIRKRQTMSGSVTPAKAMGNKK